MAWLRVHASRALWVGLGAAIAMGVWFLLGPAGALGGGWLIGLAFWLSIALGAASMLAVHALTGGRWGTVMWPALAPAAISLPVFLPLALPVLLDLHAIYPWAANPGTAPKPDVAQLYMNPAGFVLRTLVAIIGWSAFAWVLVRSRRVGARTLAGALGLVFLLGSLTLSSLDWLLSIDPRFRSTAFGIAALMTSMLAGVAWAALLRPEAEGAEPGHAADVAGLLMTTLLATLYVGFAQYLVLWYGDLPDKATWFLQREGWGWGTLQATSLFGTAVLPFACLLLERVRRSTAALAWVGFPVLAGNLAHLCWIVGPVFGPATLPAAALAVLAVGGIWLGTSYGALGTRLARVPP
jgi:hypothetical protein